MRTDPRKLLHDILTYSEEIRQFTAGMGRQQWFTDLKTRRAVERDFAIIGEAMKRLRDHHPELAERIAEKSKITGFRDKLIHDYDEIDPEIVWRAIIDDLPTLDTSIQDLMAELDPEQIKDN
ncbi:MAG: DUF86 domain-containing protein [Rhodobacteraceae bacterium]|nr:DUF86 domain-containing protein [Paracoccaceae bacterium]